MRTKWFKSSRIRVQTHDEKSLSSWCFFDLILLHRHPLQHLCGIIVTTIARHISLLLNSHRSSDSHHYTFPKIPSYHHLFVIVPSGSMQITSARATPYHRARRAVRARRLTKPARVPTNMSLPQHKYQRTHPRHTSARSPIPSRIHLHTSVRSVHVSIYFPNIHSPLL